MNPDLQGAINFRCLGGHRGHGGRIVKKGVLYRSGALSHLTEQDQQLLADLGIKHVLDYRDKAESERDQNRLWQGVHYDLCPANPASIHSAATPVNFFSSEYLEKLPSTFMETLYRKLPFGNPAYKKMFSTLQDSQGGFLHHCAVGKDRTGVGSALLLLSLGVSEDQIFADYILTEKMLAPTKEKIFERFADSWSAQAQANYLGMMAANPQWLEACFSEVLKKYSAWEDFFAVEYDLNSIALDQLRESYLE